MISTDIHFRNIAVLRRHLGLSQEELGLLIGRPQQTVSRWEAGTSVPKTSDLMTMADVFDTSIETLCGRAPIERRATVEDKLLEFKALDEGLAEAADVDKETRAVFERYVNNPEQLDREVRAMKALIHSGKTKAEMTLSEIVSTVLAA
jgi:transcriptional regulator with XRE-family HTH domain|nr:helix-turn-helix transcriptional regulator [Neorhizobium tomejilense]